MTMSVESARGATIYKQSRGGSYCCVVGCHCSSIKCFGLSFFSFPRPGVSKEQDEWRAALIHAIGRSDKSFTPMRAKICSRHFEEECIKKGPSGKFSGLVPGSMPTRWMPEQSFKTSKTARPKPKEREPPFVPVRICYTSFMDIKKDLTHLPPQWIIMKNSENDVVLGLLSSKTEEVHVKVSFSATTGLLANVSVFQMPAPWLARDIEMVRLKTFLKELGEKTLCTGVTETDLQTLAEIKITDEKYFRHITYVYENGKICSYSCVRATTCLLMVSTAETTCKDCLLVKKTLHERKNRQEAIKPNDPLRGRVIVVRNLNCRLFYPQKKAEARSNTHSFASNNKLSDVSSLKPNHFRKTVRRCGTKTFVINDKCAPFKCGECGARFALERALNLHKKAHSHKSSLPIESEGQECSVESDRQNEDIEKRDKADLMLKSIGFQVDEKTDSYQKERDHSYSDNCETWNRQTSNCEITPDKADLVLKSMVFHVDEKTDCCQKEGDHSYSDNCETWNRQTSRSEITPDTKPETPLKSGECGARFALERAHLHKKVHSNKSGLPIESEGQECSVESDRQNEDIEKRDKADIMLKSIGFQVDEKTDCIHKEGDHSYSDNCETSNSQSDGSEIRPDTKPETVAAQNLVFRYSTNTTRKGLSCPQCSYIACGPARLRNHMRTHTGEKPFKCGICEKSFTEYSALARHMRFHSGNLPHICQDCGKRFPFPSELNQHRLCHTGQKDQTCPECKAAFSDVRSLNLHMRIHTDERSFSCEICQRSFRQSGHLHRHIKSHRNEKSFLCQDCGKTFASNQYLNIHYRIHTGEQPFKCLSCPATFRHRLTFVHHLKYHRNERYLCEICHKSYASLKYFKEHHKIHRGEEFLCQECGKKFLTKLKLKNHQRIHQKVFSNQKVKTFFCETCSATFNDQSNFVRHKRIHTGVKPYSCKICNKQFNQSGGLKAHMQVHLKP